MNQKSDYVVQKSEPGSQTTRFANEPEVRRSGSAEEFFGCLDDIFLSNAVNLQQFLKRAGLAEPVLDAALEDSVSRQQKARMFEK